MGMATAKPWLFLEKSRRQRLECSAAVLAYLIISCHIQFSSMIP
jgi:hypothetical protein